MSQCADIRQGNLFALRYVASGSSGGHSDEYQVRFQKTQRHLVGSIFNLLRPEVAIVIVARSPGKQIPMASCAPEMCPPSRSGLFSKQNTSRASISGSIFGSLMGQIFWMILRVEVESPLRSWISNVGSREMVSAHPDDARSRKAGQSRCQPGRVG